MQKEQKEQKEQHYDLVVVGSGGGALLSAVRAADEGLRVLVLEKSELFGGTRLILAVYFGYLVITTKPLTAYKTI